MVEKLRPTAWKALLLTLVGFGLCLKLPALGVAVHNLFTGTVGDLGVVYTEFQTISGKHHSTIKHLEEGSPLRALGAQPGDLVVFHRFGDRAAEDTGGAVIDLSLVRAGQATRHQVQTARLPRPLWHHMDNLAITLTLVLSLFLGLSVGLVRADSPGLRWLALAMVVWACSSGGSNTQAAGIIRPVARATSSVLTMAPAYLMFLFSLRYPTSPVGRIRTGIARFRVVVGGIMAVRIGLGIAFVLGHDQPWMPAVGWVAGPITILLTLACMSESFQQSRGQLRQRAAWLLGALGLPLLLNIPLMIPGVYQTLGPAGYAALQDAAVLILVLGLSYAILRHRVFDFGFAVNRTLVFTVTSLLLVLGFWLVEQGVHKLVHVESAAGNAWLSGGIAFGLFFTFNRLHHRVDHWMEHLFFRQWRAKEEALRGFLNRAAHFRTTEALVSALGEALDHFSDGAGHAIYLRQEDQSYLLASATLPGVEKVLGVDADLVVSLRTERALIDLSDAPGSSATELALPMLLGASLEGLVLLGRKPDSRSYRPDERALLSFAVSQVALDLQALLAAQLARELRQTRQERDILLEARKAWGAT